jgi:hypothetical protein
MSYKSLSAVLGPVPRYYKSLSLDLKPLKIYLYLLDLKPLKIYLYLLDLKPLKIYFYNKYSSDI